MAKQTQNRAAVSKPAPPTSGEKFLAQVTSLFKASVGVIIVRTKEPYRALRLLHEWSLNNYPDQPFRHWDSYNGWMTKDADGNQCAGIEVLKIADPVEALARVDDLANRGTQEHAPWDKGLFVMLDLHKTIGEDKHTVTLRVLQEYTEAFVGTQQRLVFLMPDTFIVPPDLQASVPLVDLTYPTKAELRDELEQVLEDAAPSNQHREFPFNDEDTEMILDSAAGLTVQEASNAFAMGINKHQDDWDKGELTAMQLNEVVLESKTQVVKASEVLEMLSPINMDDVGGLELFKEDLETIAHALTPGAKAFGADQPKGFLLIGPPGTGKSLCAKACASRLRVPAVRFDMSRLFAGIVGATEGRTRAAFKQIEAMAPCVVLVDEIDKQGMDSRQGSGDSGVTKRVLGAMLTFMQDNTLPVVWAMTANRAELLDSAFTRAGRLDTVYSVLLPTKVERLDILKIHLRKRNQDCGLRGLEEFAGECEGYIGGELEKIVSKAVLCASMKGEKGVTIEMLEAEKAKFLPHSVVHKADYAQMEQWAAENAQPTSRLSAKEKAQRELVREQAISSQPVLKVESKFSVEQPPDGGDFTKKRKR